ncbi:MAG TPA: hypothetical protein VHO25_16395, partial [Polyangiaceae bacterium]|nr:hypothetical protein [Polyangiaceae bacterium]
MSSDTPQRNPTSSSNAADALLPWGAVVPAAALAVFLGRGLAPALPGSRAGIEAWITHIETGTTTLPALGAWLTQLTLLSASWLSMHFSLVLLGQRSIPAPLRFVVTTLGALLFAIVSLANVAQGQLGGSWLIAAASSALLLATVAAARALRQPTTRATGLILLGSAASGALQLGSRVLALDASNRARAADFVIAQRCASAAFVLTTATLVFALYWLWTSDRKRQITLVALAVLPTGLITSAALSGGGEAGTWWQHLAARTLSELRTHPDPLILVPLRDGVELCALFAGVVVLARANTPTSVSAVAALALISRGNVDIPLCALLLGCAALLCLTVTNAGERVTANNGAKREQTRRAESTATPADPSLHRAPTLKMAAAGYP